PAGGLPGRARAGRRRRRALGRVPAAMGKTYGPITYAVGREKIREYAYAVEETNQVYADLEVARASGYRDLVAPPMFAVVYSSPVLMNALVDPEIGLDFSRMVHGAQEFVWGPVVVAGDEITTEAELVS